MSSAHWLSWAREKVSLTEFESIKKKRNATSRQMLRPIRYLCIRVAYYAFDWGECMSAGLSPRNMLFVGQHKICALITEYKVRKSCNSFMCHFVCVLLKTTNIQLNIEFSTVENIYKVKFKRDKTLAAGNNQCSIEWNWHWYCDGKLILWIGQHWITKHLTTKMKKTLSEFQKYTPETKIRAHTHTHKGHIE